MTPIEAWSHKKHMHYSDRQVMVAVSFQLSLPMVIMCLIILLSVSYLFAAYAIDSQGPELLHSLPIDSEVDEVLDNHLTKYYQFTSQGLQSTTITAWNSILLVAR
jgi:hypothetical protein